MYRLIINLKTYEESTGNNAIAIAKAAKELEVEAKKLNVEIILCSQAIDIREIINMGVSVYAQHVDDYDYGAHTGFTVPKAIKSAGVKGTLLNHSEHRLPIKQIRKEIEICKKIGLESCVCVVDSFSAKFISEFSPDIIAVEPPELIGGDISVSHARPELVSEASKRVSPIPLLVGAGVKNKEDVEKAVKLGAKGILVASGVVKANDVKGKIKELLEGFNSN